MKSTFLFGAIGFGFLLLLVSLAWSSLFPATRSWSDEKATQRAEVQDRIHNLRFLLAASPNQRSFHSHAPENQNTSRSPRDPVEIQAELDELTKVNEQLNAEFQSAYDRPNTIAAVLKWTGIALAGIGILGYFAVREE